MNLPLYNELKTTPPKPQAANSHYGLWFERYADFYKADFSETNAGAEWLTKHFARNVGDNKQLDQHLTNQHRLINSLDGQALSFKSTWHFVTGMGNPHPIENGFSWHPTLGVPYLSGAAIKGLVRSYIETYLDENAPKNPEKKALLLQWFGSTDKNPTADHYKAETGALIFFDALPMRQVTLGVDIMTPHMGKWYEQGASKEHAGNPEAVPADWHDPVPIAFLVAKQMSLYCSFALRPHAQTDLDLDDVKDVLILALGHHGAGAKTATGYGQMRYDPVLLDELETTIQQQQEQRLKAEQQAAAEAAKQAQLAQLNPLEREIAEFNTILDAVKALNNGQWQDEQQRQAAHYLKARMEQENVWKETTQKKKPEKDKPHQNTLTVMKYL